jgi:hypothetical protein
MVKRQKKLKFKTFNPDAIRTVEAAHSPPPMVIRDFFGIWRFGIWDLH